ncbi:hypothetical protein ABEB36_008316 [Hypothenemus hampei]|uniref:Uncharacterized protein n=1 Tax=Hypothenemus hampei TaxID=57062 RepID=A0ABD1EM14_HYPHA
MHAPQQSSNESAASGSTFKNTLAAVPRLPVLQLPEFSGNPSDWQSFADTLRSLGALKGKAAASISALSISKGNYKIAWDILKKRYENRNILINSHLRDIFGIQPIGLRIFKKFGQKRRYLRYHSNIYFTGKAGYAFAEEMGNFH